MSSPPFPCPILFFLSLLPQIKKGNCTIIFLSHNEERREKKTHKTNKQASKNTPKTKPKSKG